MIYGLGITILTLLVTLIVLSWQLRRQLGVKKVLQERFLALETKVDDLQLSRLESKLNPHLFKNILNSIQSHAYQTYFALDKLANVLDYILYESQKKYVSPKAEIDFALSLIEINKIKLSPLFQIEVKCKVNEGEKYYEQPALAPLISIDLIENAFKHADLQSPDAFITIVFEFRNDVFHLTVANKISEKKPLLKEKSGLGAATLEQRLKIIYKDHFLLEKFADNHVYTAHLKIDLLGYNTQMHPA